MATILVVEDEPRIAQIASDYLERAGYDVVHVDRGAHALQRARTEQPALVVLDLALPDMDGLDVARALRSESSVPIIMLTARVEEHDRLRGLALGADDYVTKPFSPRELVARVRAVLRRTHGSADGDAPVQLGDLLIDAARHRVTRNGQSLDLTDTEFRLLSTLARQPGRVFTRGQLLEAIRGDGTEAYDRAVDAHIKNLRRKIETTPHTPSRIVTVYGVGYKAESE